MFSYKIYELFKNTYFYKTPPLAAPENNEQQQLLRVLPIVAKIVSPIPLQELIHSAKIHLKDVLKMSCKDSRHLAKMSFRCIKDVGFANLEDILYSCL